MTPEETNIILAEDARRRRARLREPYDPVRGDSSDPARCRVATPLPDMPVAWVPRTMADDPAFQLVQADPLAWKRLRFRHDFPYWCVECVKIKPKLGFIDEPFVLNRPQLKLLAALEADRLAGRPIRVILLKARQWGGSTLIQTYMAWIQLVHRPNWHSVICSNSRDTSATVRNMFDKLLACYPEDFWPDGVRPELKPLRLAANTVRITGRECRVTVGSVFNHDFARGSDIAMAHLTEVAFWSDTPRHSPDDLIRAVCGSVALLPYTLVAIESTANGVGNFFHREWMRCRDGHADKRTVFVPWYEIDMYRLEPPDPAAFAASLDDYERALWDRFGLCLDQIYWYRLKRREQTSHQRMMAEYPTTDDEAFTATTWSVFHREAVEALRAGCREGAPGEALDGPRWAPDPSGLARMWSAPEPDGLYVAAVDIGGRTEAADWSVIAVLRVDTNLPEVVAQWRGHADHDILADIASRLGALYNDALLIVESNTLETSGDGHGAYILDRLADTYPNLYFRSADDEAGAAPSRRPGFHTNRATKERLIAGMVRTVREGAYIERDTAACDELLTYEVRPDGRYGAKPGCHDDILMTRAIALCVAEHRYPGPGSPRFTSAPGW